MNVSSNQKLFVILAQEDTSESELTKQSAGGISFEDSSFVRKTRLSKLTTFFNDWQKLQSHPASQKYPKIKNPK